MGRPGGNRRIRGGGRALTWRYEVWSLQHFEIKILSEKIFKALYVRDNFTIFLIVCIGCTWAVWVDARTSRDQEHQSHQSWIVIGPTVTSSQLYHSITASFDEHWPAVIGALEARLKTKAKNVETTTLWWLTKGNFGSQEKMSRRAEDLY